MRHRPYAARKMCWRCAELRRCDLRRKLCGWLRFVLPDRWAPVSRPVERTVARLCGDAVCPATAAPAGIAAKTPSPISAAAANAIVLTMRIASLPQRSSLENNLNRDYPRLGEGPLGRDPRNLPGSILLEFDIPCHEASTQRTIRGARRPPFVQACRDAHRPW